MKIKYFQAAKYFSKKIGKDFNSNTTFGEMDNYKKIIKLLPNSNIIIFPKKFVA